jgi:hypothetical protein
MNRFFPFVLVLVVLCSTGYAGTKNADRGSRRTAPGIHPVLTSAVFAPGVIFQEGFNDTLLGKFPPAGWKMVNNDNDAADNAWYQSGTIGDGVLIPPFEGLAFATDNYESANAANLIDDYFITPNTGGSATAGSVDSLVFWLASRLSNSGNYPDSLQIRVSTTDTAISSFTTLLAFLQAPKNVWTRYAFNLPIVANRYIAFRYLIYDGGPNGASSDKIGIDDVRILRYTPTAVGEPQTIIPESFGMKQNYPNPFNPSTKIEFAIPASAYARLVVYDALGRAVVTLVDGELAAGVHVRDFDAAGLAGGVYFCRLSAGPFTQTRQMLLVK